jgi:hypothetical protein
MHYISQAHAYLINPSKIHRKCTKVQHHKFIITSSTSQSSTSPTAATETAGVAPRTTVKERTAAKG